MVGCPSFCQFLGYHFHSHPEPAGDESPEEDEEAIAPVDGDDGAVVANAVGNGESHLVRVELEGVVVPVCQEGGAHESWTDVVEVDVANASDVAELGETFHIMIVVALGGGVGWGGTQSACPCNAADDSEVGGALGVLLEVVEGGVDHLREAHDVGGTGGHLPVEVEGGVLIADACAVEIEVHATRLADEGEQTTGCVGLCDVDALGGDDIEVLALNLLQPVLATPCNAHLPTLGSEHLDQFQPDAGGGTDDDGFLLFHIHFGYKNTDSYWKNQIILLPLSPQKRIYL